MAGTRYSKQGVSQAVEGWEAPLNDDINNILGPSPFAAPEVANIAALPAANTMRNCMVIVQDYDGAGTPCIAWSNGVAWTYQAFVKNEFTMGSDSPDFDCLLPAIPLHDSFELQMWLTQKAAGTGVPFIRLGDATSFDTGTVHASCVMGSSGGAMSQTNANLASSIAISPSGLGLSQNYELMLRCLFQKIDGTKYFVSGQTFLSQDDGSATLSGSTFQGSYGGSKTIDRVRVGLGGSVNIDSTRARAEIRLL